MSVHLLVSDARFRCGKRPAYNLAHTDNINEVTCKTCIEAHLFNNGKIREYRLGGRFEKGVTPRRHESHWSYRKENKAMGEKIKELEAKIKLQDQRIENLLKAVEFYGNPMNYHLDSNVLGYQRPKDDTILTQWKDDDFKYSGVVGGKLARKCQAKDQELLKELESLK